MILIADGRIIIDVILEDGTVSKGVANIDKSLGGIGDTAKRTSLSIGKIATALGLVYIAKKGIDLVKQSLEGAISRYDTLNQFPRVLRAMGFDANESKAAIEKLSEGIDGLPTRLDEVAATAQNIAVMTGDLDSAVDTTIALNNAFLASGASTDQASRGMQQYIQMMATGQVDGQAWKTLQETMGVALSKVADEFGFTGKAAKEDLFKALKSGEITMEEFNDQLIKVNEGQGGLAELAIENSKGIETSWENIKTAAVMGVAGVIAAIDQALGGTGEIEDALDRVKGLVKVVFSWIANQVPVVAGVIETLIDIFQEIADKAMEVYKSIKPWLPLIAAIATGIGTFLLFANAATMLASAVGAAVSVFNVIKAAIVSVRIAMITLNAAMMLNPFALIAAAIMAAAVLIYVYWEPISEFFIMIWHAIRDAGLEIWENLKEGWANAVQVLTETWQSVTGFFSNLWQDILNTIETAYNWLNDKTNGAFGIYVDIIQSYLMTAWEIVKSIWSYIQDTFSNFLSFIKALVTLDFQGMKDAMQKQMETSKKLLSDIWQAIKSNIGAKLKEILSAVIDKFNDVKSNIKDKITQAKDALVQKLVEMVTNTAVKLANLLLETRNKFENVKQAIRDKITQAKDALVQKLVEMVTNTGQKLINLVTTVRNKFQEVKQAIQDKMKDAVKALVDKVAEMPGKVRDKASDMLTAGKDLIRGLIDGIKNMASDAVDAITGVVDGVVGKAKSLLKIKSPSRVFKEIGNNISVGLAKGIDDKAAEADKVTMRLVKQLADIAKDGNKQIAAINKKANTEAKQLEKRAQEDINLIHAKAKQQKRKLTQAESVRIRRIEEDTAKKVNNIHAKAAKEVEKIEKDKSKKLDEIRSKELQKSKDWIEYKKNYQNASLKEEYDDWLRVQNRYAKGTNQRKEAEKELLRVKQEIHDKLTSLNDEYLKNVEDINQKLIDEEKRLNEEYAKALDDRTKSLYSFAGIFDEIKNDTAVSGQQLINNLRGQVDTFTEWTENINSLASRGIDDALLNELRDMGPKAAAEIAALNGLTDDQLNEYVGLWKQKNKLAREQATEELEGLKKDTEKKIRELHEQTDKQLEQLTKTWKNKVLEIRYGAKDEFSVMKSDLNTIGKQAIQGMINGLDSMSGALMAKAQSIANAVKATISSALEIHSPSKWMRNMIGKNMMLGWMQGIDAEKAAMLRKADEMSSWMKPNVPTGFTNRLRGVTAPIGNITPANSGYGGNSSVTHHNSRAYNPTIKNYFTKDESTPSEVARKNKQQQQRLAMEWGY